MDTIDVLIVGGGPTGLMLALELAAQDVSFRIIDKAPHRSEQSRALVVQPRSLELLNRHGMAQDLVAQGSQNKVVQLFVHKKQALKINALDIAPEDCQFPTVLFISQAETEKFLESALKEKYCKNVEWSITIDDLKDEQPGNDDVDSHAITATLHSAKGEASKIHAKYVVGCDGAHSIVRHAAGLNFDGASYPQDFILADTHLNFTGPETQSQPQSPTQPQRTLSITNLTICLGTSGFMTVFPLKDNLYRLICIRPGNAITSINNNGHENPDTNGNTNTDTPPTVEDFQSALDSLSPVSAKIHSPVWITRFRLHHRQVNNYRSGRFFVAGDAAHIHSPAGGQGMNTGLQDAANLAWKLGLAIHHTSRGPYTPSSLLESYHSERWKVGRRVLNTTDKLFEAISSKSALTIRIRNFVAGWILPWAVWFLGKKGLRGRFRFLSQVGIRYRESGLVQTGDCYKGALRGGDRAPDGKVDAVSRGREGERALYLLDLCRGRKHHLVLFLGGKMEGITTAQAESLESFIEENREIFDVVRIFGSKTDRELQQEEEERYSDTDGTLHSLYGFQNEPGYVLIRPDGYIAHIGPLSAIEQVRSWFRK
ncbi:FAD binding domain-containing protein [Xylogone sp. PMI_703]|nr:FAD binding domain-containing protein [Xylogone sp. PMI_703]